MLSTAYESQELDNSSSALNLASDDTHKKPEGYLADGMPEWNTDYSKLEGRTERQREVIKMLHEAAAADRPSTLHSLIKVSHINPNLRHEKGWTALLRASKRGAVKAVEVLCGYRADLNTATKNLNTAMHKAAKQGHEGVVRVLIANGARLDVRNDGGATPLMMGVLHRREGIVDALLRAGARVNIQKDVGYTALMIAIRKNSATMTGALLQAKAKLTLRDKQGETAMAKAQKYGANNIMELLRDYGAEHDSSRQGHTHYSNLRSGAGRDRHAGGGVVDHHAGNIGGARGGYPGSDAGRVHNSVKAASQHTQPKLARERPLEGRAKHDA